MAETVQLGKELVVEIENRKNLGDKKFHSETSLQNLSGEADRPAFITTKDPGVSTHFVLNCEKTVSEN